MVFLLYTYSPAVEGLDPEKIGIEVNLVSKEAEIFVEQHIQNPPKTVLGKIVYSRLNIYSIYNDQITTPKCDKIVNTYKN